MQNDLARFVKAQVRNPYGVADLCLPDGREFSLHRPDKIDIRPADESLQNLYLYGCARVNQPLEVLYDAGPVPCQHQGIAKMKIGRVQCFGTIASLLDSEFRKKQRECADGVRRDVGTAGKVI